MNFVRSSFCNKVAISYFYLPKQTVVLALQPQIFSTPQTKYMFMYINMIMSFVLMTIILHIFLKKSMTTNVDITLAELYDI